MSMPISNDMELSDFDHQQHTYLCHAKNLEDDDMIKMELIKIGTKMAGSPDWMKK